MHGRNIGSALAGISTLIVAAAALIRGPAALREWVARQRAEATAAREQAETVMLDRRRYLNGWSGHGVDTFGVALVTAKDELAQAAKEIADGARSAYVVLRVSEGGGDHDADRARSLTQVIKAEGYISRPPESVKRSEPVSTLWASRGPHTRVRGREDPALPNGPGGRGHSRYC